MSEIGVCFNPGFQISKRSQFLHAGIESYIKVNSNKEKKLYSSSKRQEDMYTCLRGNITGFNRNQGAWIVPETGFYRITVHANYRTNYKRGKDIEGMTFTKVLVGDDIILGQTNVFDKTSGFYSSKVSFSGIVRLKETKKVILSLFQTNKLQEIAFTTIEFFVDYVSKADKTIYTNVYEGGVCDDRPKRITFNNESLYASKLVLNKEYTDEGLFFKAIVDFLVGQDYDKGGKFKIKDLPSIPPRKPREKTLQPTPKFKKLSSGNTGFVPGELPAISGIMSRKSKKGKEKVTVPTLSSSTEIAKKPSRIARTVAPVRESAGKPGSSKPNLRIITGNAALESYATAMEADRNSPINKLTLIMRDGREIEFPATGFNKINLYGPSQGNMGFKIVTNEPEIVKYKGKSAGNAVSKIRVDYGPRKSEFSNFVIADFPPTRSSLRKN